MELNCTCFCVSTERYMKKRKYDILDTSHLETDDEDEDDVDDDVVDGNEKMSGKLKVGVIIPNLQPKILLSMKNLRRLRDGYEEVMHRFAQHLIQLNNGGTNALTTTNPLFVAKSVANLVPVRVENQLKNKR